MEVITINIIVENLVNDGFKLLELLYDNQVTILDDTFVPVKQEEMAKQLDVTRATINTLLKKLRENKLIEDYSDTKKYRLTPLGIKYVKNIKKF